MLPEPHRLHHHSEFSRTVRRGHRIGKRDIVVHAFDRARLTTDTGPELSFGGPRFGLIVSKSIGNAVERHSVARRLRHVCSELRDEVRPDVDVVIRALPGAASSSSAELLRQVRSGVTKLKVLGTEQ
ncbi:ribonuclease P protein component [Antrihabitans cavernicola]|uniref:Ribonuclease P protein component n=1 Tax=Antrihabitans cavernicola TaxID=2495913 RepID=A0A5A7SL53_9NOCA|nr:ribonuclease P protein component [Spelaeibacter cavernicola]KAA0024961.1 ribonuclease P protein component [Spelaeibacter cavernicola]